MWTGAPPPGTRLPVEPPRSEWEFPDPDRADLGDLIAIGATLDPGTLLAAYRAGMFPMPEGRRIGWWSPNPRGVIPLRGVHVSRSLRRSLRTFDVTFNRAFVDVVRACGDPRRPLGWIDENIVEAYAALHRLGWAHSIEVRRDGHLVGGLYGVRIGGLFAGESMFHTVTDASKVALVHTVAWLDETQATLFDVQWTTPHLRSLGAIDIPRSDYLGLARAAVAQPNRPVPR